MKWVRKWGILRICENTDPYSQDLWDEIQHAELIEGVAAKSKEILAGTISHDFMPMFIKSMGLVLVSRIKFIHAKQNGGLQLISNSRDYQNVLGLSVFLQVLRITSMGSMRGALHDFYGE